MRSPIGVIGLDVSRTVAAIAYLDAGRIRASGMFELTHPLPERFAQSLRATDHAVLEDERDTAAIAAEVEPHIARVVVATPLQSA